MNNRNEIGETTRQQKINRLLQKELSTIFQQRIQQQGLKLIVSISIVRISPDLSQAKVYLSVYPSAQAEEICATANSEQSQIRFEIGNRLRHSLRIIPELRFFIDDSLDYLEHIDNILKQ